MAKKTTMEATAPVMTAADLLAQVARLDPSTPVVVIDDEFGVTRAPKLEVVQLMVDKRDGSLTEHSRNPKIPVVIGVRLNG